MKRKARNKINKKKLDMVKPIDITIFGTDDDPCFGKHHDPKAAECQRCGDSEICSIVCVQKQSIKREAIEEKGRFKDIENEVKPHLRMKEIQKLILKKLKKLKRIRLTKVYNLVKNKWDDKNLLSKKEITQLVRSAVKKEESLKIVKSDGKRYIKKVKK